MERLGRFLKSSLKDLRLEEGLAAGRVFSRWPEVVGDFIASKTRPLQLNRGVLTVEVASAAWANELNLLKPKLMAAIAKTLGPGVIRDLRWQLPGARTRQSAQVSVDRPAGPFRIPVLPDAERERIRRDVAARIPDAELAQTVSGFIEILERRKRLLRGEGASVCGRCGVHYRERGTVCPLCRLQS